MSRIENDIMFEGDNPIDSFEESIIQRDWPADRVSENELAAEFLGNWCDIRVWLSWNPELCTLIINCAMESKIPEKLKQKVHSLLSYVNERIVLGCFVSDSIDGVVSYRYTSLLKSSMDMNGELAGDIIDIAFAECERFYPALQSVLWSDKSPEEALEIVMFDTVGEA